MEFSSNGWQASADKNEIRVKNYMVEGTTRHFAITKDAAPILCAFFAEFHKLVEPIDTGTFDDWGHSYRPVRGATKLSNHASGTACDVNATKHGLGLIHTFRPEQVQTIQGLIAKYSIGWGGNYKVRKDDMHFEIVESPQLVKARIASMGLKMPKEKK
jgi:hypothetical protein